MSVDQIKQKIKTALADFWWCPAAFTVVERPEISYCLDPLGAFNIVSKIDDQHPNLESLVHEFSDFFRGHTCTVNAFADQDPRLFEILKREGYHLENTHDIRYQLVSEHPFKKKHSVKL